MVSSIFESLNVYLKLFYFLGLSPKVELNSISDVSSRLPIVAHFAFYLTLDIIFVILTNYPSLNDDEPVEVTMANLLVFSDGIKVICVFYQSYVHSRTLATMLRRFHDIDTLFSDFENWHLDYKCFRVSFARKWKINMIIYAFNVIFFITRSIQIGFSTPVAYKFWELLNTISIIHTVFYIDLLRYHLLQLNLIIRNEITYNHIVENPAAYEKRIKYFWMLRKLKISKIIYYRLWEISQDLNESFGWTISALMLELFNNATYCAYWIWFTGRFTRAWAALLRMLICFSKLGPTISW